MSTPHFAACLRCPSCSRLGLRASGFGLDRMPGSRCGVYRVRARASGLIGLGLVHAHGLGLLWHCRRRAADAALSGRRCCRCSPLVRSPRGRGSLWGSLLPATEVRNGSLCRWLYSLLTGECCCCSRCRVRCRCCCCCRYCCWHCRFRCCAGGVVVNGGCPAARRVAQTDTSAGRRGPRR